MTYTIRTLRRLLQLAKELGFQDDVEHWESELRKFGVEP